MEPICFPLDRTGALGILCRMSRIVKKCSFSGEASGKRATIQHAVARALRGSRRTLGRPLAILVPGLFLLSTACHEKKRPTGWKNRPVNLEPMERPGPTWESTGPRGNWKAPDSSPLAEPCRHAWPLDDLDVTSPYGHRLHPVVHRVLFHRGIDLAAPRGTPVLSTAQGLVEFTGRLPLTGNTVIVAHPDGTQSLYAHLDGVLVFPGEVVDRRAPVGLVGSTGRSTGPHLHYQLNRGGASVDPTLSLERIDP